MRITWKDTAPHTKPWVTLKYRGYTITQYDNGWVTDMPGDNNIYYPRECALNSIDNILGGKTRKSNPQRHSLGVNIIGTKRKEDAG